MGLYFSLHPRGCSGDILQPSHVPHKNCQWVRSEDFPKTTQALMHSNTLHYNDISHQQWEGETHIERWKVKRREREREKWLSVCLYPTVNYLVKVTNLINASLRLSSSLSLLSLSLGFFCFFLPSFPQSPSPPPYLLINWEPRGIVCNLFNCMYCSPVPRRLCFFIKISAGNFINQRRRSIR